MSTKSKYSSSRAYIYIRISSKEQENGYSLDAQLRHIIAYASKHGIEIVGTPIIEIASAKDPGRKKFNDMVKLLKKESRKKSGQRIDAVLTEKTDRIVRNHKDKETLLDLGVTIHLTKENLVVSLNSASVDLYMFDSYVSSATRYSRNLGEESSKGMQEKAEEGWYPSKAPIGYKNKDREDGKKIIVTDPKYVPIIKSLFEQYATGRYSLSTVIHHVNDMIKSAGLKRKLCKSTLAEILANPFYCGSFLWKGKSYNGKHPAIIAREQFDQVQLIRHGSNKHARQGRDKDKWLFQGMLFCGICGCAIVAELKKGRYIYYHCTGNKGKCAGTSIIQQHLIETQVVDVLKQLSMSVLPLDNFSKIVKDSQADARERQKFDVSKLNSEIEKNEQRQHKLLLRSLDDEIEDDVYQKTDKQFIQNITECRQRLQALAAGQVRFIETQEQLSTLLKKAVELFQMPKRPDSEKRQLVKTFLGRCLLKNGQLIPVLRPPFSQYVPIGS